jgi:hypothetical protein
VFMVPEPELRAKVEATLASLCADDADAET